MRKVSYSKVRCPKCGREYAIGKGSTGSFHCPGKNCHELLNAQAKPVKPEKGA